MAKEVFIEKLLSAAVAAGISEAEAYYQENESMRILMEGERIGQYAVNTTGGLTFRGFYQGRMGNAFTEALDDEAINMLIENVKASAMLITDEDEQFIFAGSPAYEALDCTGSLGTASERIDKALALSKQGVSIDPRVVELGIFTGVASSNVTVTLMNTKGLHLQHNSQFCSMFIEGIAREGDSVSTAFSFDSKRNLSDMDIQAFTRKCISDAALGLHAVPCDSGEMPVIFRGSAMADMLQAFDSIFSADDAQRGLSLLAGKEGETIGAACVTIMDDPLRQDCMASCPFDDEGVATKTKKVVENGVLRTLLHNLKTAKKAGCESTGNASRPGMGASIGVAPSNFFIAPGEMDLNELQASMQNGVVITDVEGLHAGAHPISGDFSLLSKGYLVKNGKRSGAVEQITVAGNFFTLLKDVVAVGSDLQFPFGNYGSPSVWVRKLSIAGK